MTSGPLHCEMIDSCDDPVAMIDDKGYIYCAEHGLERRRCHRRRCRKLRPSELKRLERGEALGSYSPKRRKEKP